MIGINLVEPHRREKLVKFVLRSMRHRSLRADVFYFLCFEAKESKQRKLATSARRLATPLYFPSFRTGERLFGRKTKLLNDQTLRKEQ